MKPTPERRGKQWAIRVYEEVVDDGQKRRRVRRIALRPATLPRAPVERLRDDYLGAINKASVGIRELVCFATLHALTAKGTFFPIAPAPPGSAARAC